MNEAPAAPARTAIIFFTHVFDQNTHRALLKLEHEAAGFGEQYVLSDAAVPWTLVKTRAHQFDFGALCRRYTCAFGKNLIPGNGHLPVISLYEDHPEYDYYWIIEHDVRFSGSWSDFFDVFLTSTADLIAPHIRRYADEPGWYWWSTLCRDTAPPEPESMVRAFLTIYRISGRALALLKTAAERGAWRGHHECLVPSLLHSHGLRLDDIGGDGPFTPPERIGRFYTTFAFRGNLRHFGTMRHRPPFALWGSRRHFLYHPVKSGTGIRQAAAANAMLCLGYCLKHLLSAHGHVFLRDLVRYCRLWFSRRT